MEKTIKIIVMIVVLFGSMSFILLKPTFDNKFVYLGKLNVKDDCSDILENENEFNNIIQYHSPYFDKEDRVKPIVIYKIINKGITEYSLTVRESTKTEYKSKDKLIITFSDDSDLILNIESKENPYQNKNIDNHQYNTWVKLSLPEYLTKLSNKKIALIKFNGNIIEINSDTGKEFLKNVNCIILK